MERGNPIERQKILSKTDPEIIEEARQRLQKKGADFKALDAAQARCPIHLHQEENVEV